MIFQNTEQQICYEVRKVVFLMLLLIKLTLSCIDDQTESCTFTIYENVRLFILLKRDPRGRSLLWSSVYTYTLIDTSEIAI